MKYTYRLRIKLRCSRKFKTNTKCRWHTFKQYYNWTNNKISQRNKIVTWVILVLLIIISTAIISNTIKLTVHARRKEISIMKYVGATNSFIRWPFLVEGIIIGVVAGAISVGIIGLAYTYIVGQISGTSFFEIANIKFIEFSSMSELLILVYLGLGIGVGAIGSTISMKKYLEV